MTQITKLIHYFFVLLYVLFKFGKQKLCTWNYTHTTNKKHSFTHQITNIHSVSHRNELKVSRGDEAPKRNVCLTV